MKHPFLLLKSLRETHKDINLETVKKYEELKYTLKDQIFDGSNLVLKDIISQANRGTLFKE